MSRIVASYFNTIQAFLTCCQNFLWERLTVRLARNKLNLLKTLINLTPSNHPLNLGVVYKLKQKSFWMKKRSSDWWENIVLNTFMAEDWLENFRMSKDTFLWLCRQLENHLKPSDSALVWTRIPLSVEKQVAVCLYFLSSCAEYRVIANAFGIHKTTVWKCVHNVVDAINSVLLPTFIRMPDEGEAKNIAHSFNKITKIPNLIGALDGSHIPVLPPSDGYRDFINRKGWPSIVLQAVVDHQYMFRNINCSSPGSSHDAAIFKKSLLGRQLNKIIPKGFLTIVDFVCCTTCVTPGRKCKCRKEEKEYKIPYMIMADSAYPLLPNILKGYIKHKKLTPEEESFNVYLNSGRVVVENAFGRLKGRWRALQKRLDIHFSYVPHVVSACCVLHNIVESRKETFCSQWLKGVQLGDIEIPQPEEVEFNENDSINASDNRDILNVVLQKTAPLRKSVYQ